MGGFTYYDEDDFFDRYQNRRNRVESPNNAMERPALMQLIGHVKGKDILDLGCGDGQFGAELLSEGASSYHGIDGSVKMIEKAKEILTGTSATLEQVDLNRLKIEDRRYDLVVSRFVLHYLPEVKDIFHKVHHVLKDDGKFVFSVQHPVITASMKSAEGQQRTNWIVDDYFEIGERMEPWINQPVRKYHRTVEHYVTELIKAGFTLEGLKEGKPERHRFTTQDEFERRKRIPLALILSGCKG